MKLKLRSEPRDGNQFKFRSGYVESNHVLNAFRSSKVQVLSLDFQPQVERQRFIISGGEESLSGVSSFLSSAGTERCRNAYLVSLTKHLPTSKPKNLCLLPVHLNNCPENIGNQAEAIIFIGLNSWRKHAIWEQLNKQILTSKFSSLTFIFVSS